jgi:hypothetical protein
MPARKKIPKKRKARKKNETVRQILLLIRDDASVEVVELVAKLSYGPGCEVA